MSYRVESLWQVQQKIRSLSPEGQSAYASLTRSLAADPWRVGNPTRSKNVRITGFFELYEATFQIEDTHVTVTIIEVR
ncbi:hypothetical protein [Embleya scabrispora]|uniref:hypothetical protein n=1 Tax=Embleya scabrispora TaxID=159449 RepID=UPI00035EDA3E|nr:hypothetical protein [Embleya scabrispora]MYS82688.1 hypothetical protein [Streptomyces sp. SID5474]